MNVYSWQPWFFFWERRRVGSLVPVDDPDGVMLAGDLADGHWEYRRRRRYIRTGDALTTYDGDDPASAAVFQHVKVEGWGAGAEVKGGARGIRRDQIHKDENGNWIYHYRD